ncbi:hypothetical protein [Streptomyces sp. NPDC006879]|uniref:hypothetical protein n=1 Tax=Streptomyces sp. NPDC006879 TaxID=3364767 RepID=UPI0036910376
MAICGARLDESTPTQDQPSRQHLDLQGRILAKLDPRHPAEQSANYFTELHLLSSLIIATWPAANLKAPDTTTLAADRVLAQRRMEEEASITTFASHHPPVDARACAAILLTADTMLSSPDMATAVAPLMPTNEPGYGRKAQLYNTWEAAFKGVRQECSPEFQQAADTVLTTYRCTGQRGRRRPHPKAGFLPMHVPAFLLDDWADRHLAEFPVINPRALRRSSAVLLVQRAKGGSAGEASQFLGMNLSGKQIGAVRYLVNRLRSAGLIDKFDAAIDCLAGELERAPLINYQRRREALLGWSISVDTWHELLEQTSMSRARRDIANDDGRRMSSSIYVWAEVTKGEQRFAPFPPTATRDQGRHYLVRGDAYPAFGALRHTLDSYADRLATAIDAGTQVDR